MSDSIAKANIAETFLKTEKAVGELQEVLTKVNQTDNSLGALVNDKQLYNHLNEASEQLNSLLEDVQKHPKRYVSFPLIGSSKDKEKKEKNKNKE